MSDALLRLTEDASLRGKQDDNGMWWFSVYNFINFVCDKEEGSSYHYVTWKRLVSETSEHRDEVLTHCKYLKFAGSGQRDTPCMTIKGLQRLLMLLGGKVAGEYRQIVEGVFTRYMAGDTSLVEEIRANAASDAPVQQLCRNALEHEAPAALGKRKLDELQMEERRLVLEEKRFALEEKQAQEKFLLVRSEAVEKMNSVMEKLDPNWKRDEAFVRRVKDYVQNGAAGAEQRLAITAGGEQASAPLSISDVAMEMKARLSDKELQDAGRAMRKLYLDEFGVEPVKGVFWHNGREIPCNTYNASHREMMERAINKAVAPRTRSRRISEMWGSDEWGYAR